MELLGGYISIQIHGTSLLDLVQQDYSRIKQSVTKGITNISWKIHWEIHAVNIWRDWKDKWKDLKHKLYAEKLNTKNTNGKHFGDTKMHIKDQNM